MWSVKVYRTFWQDEFTCFKAMSPGLEYPGILFTSRVYLGPAKHVCMCGTLGLTMSWCRQTIGHMWRRYLEIVEQHENGGEMVAFDELGLKRYCCRRMLRKFFAPCVYMRHAGYASIFTTTLTMPPCNASWVHVLPDVGNYKYPEGCLGHLTAPFPHVCLLVVRVFFWHQTYTFGWSHSNVVDLIWCFARSYARRPDWEAYGLQS